MRLTLRSMLNYMDDVLEPADSQVIAQKIEESEFATDLMHRIRDVTRRLRMAAPKIDGRGIGLDPNTVAEYLDNTLASGRVADFEKLCLESDIHLAEVAGCHQVLALVLGEPAEISPAIRHRMYQIGTQQRQPAASPAAAHAPAPAAPPAVAHAPTVQAAAGQSAAGHAVTMPTIDTSGDRGARKKPEVPDYLREPKTGRGRVRAILAACVLAILIGGGYAAYDSGKLDQFFPSEKPAEDDGNQTAAKQPAANQPAVPENTPPAVASGAPPQAPPTSEPANPTGAVATAGEHPAAGPPATAAAGATPAASTPPVPPPNQVAGNESVKPDPTDLRQPASPPTMTPDRPPVPPTAAATPAPEPPGPARPATTSVAGGLAPAPADLVGNPAPVVTPEGLGRLISDREVLLRFDAKSQAWVRLTTRATVFPGDRLLSLPTYRASVTLTAGVSLQLLGGTLVELLPPDSRGVPGLRLLDGRAILLTFGKPGAQIKVWAGNRQGFVTFADPDSTLAAEVVRMRIDGSNPEKEPATVTVNLYATAGLTTWSDETHLQPVSLQSPSRMSFAPGVDSLAVEPIPADQVPSWVKGDERPAMEKRASVAVEEALEADRPISLGLKELAGDRRTEVSSLADQCLAEIDEFESVVIALNDPLQRAAWNTLIESLRTAIARSPVTAEKVRLALEHHRGPEGDELYRMLWGYSPDQLQSGAAAQLVRYLDHDDLDFRELAFWNLTRIAGSSGHFYRPTDPQLKRQPALRAWKQKLDAGALFGKPPG